MFYVQNVVRIWSVKMCLNMGINITLTQAYCFAVYMCRFQELFIMH